MVNTEKNRQQPCKLSAPLAKKNAYSQFSFKFGRVFDPEFGLLGKSTKFYLKLAQNTDVFLHVYLEY